MSVIVVSIFVHALKFVVVRVINKVWHFIILKFLNIIIIVIIVRALSEPPSCEYTYASKVGPCRLVNFIYSFYHESHEIILRTGEKYKEITLFPDISIYMPHMYNYVPTSEIA